MMTDKLFSSIRAFTDNPWLKRPKSCLLCDKPVTKEVVYSVGNDMSVIERYCSDCAEKVVQAQKRSVD